jgi:PKD repeat protein
MEGHKTLFLFLGLLVVVGLIYLGSNRFSTDKASLSKALESGKNSASVSGQVLGAEAIKGVLGGVDSLIAKTEQVIKNSAIGLAKDVGNSAKDQLTEAIFGSSTVATPRVEVVPQAQSIASVCSSYSKNQPVSYILKFSSTSTNQTYSVDWGDGETSGGSAVSLQIPVSHSYGNPGSYSVSFKSGTLQSERDICVK